MDDEIDHLNRHWTGARIARDAGCIESATRTVEGIVRLGNDVALIRYRWQGHGQYQGVEFRDDHRGVTVFRREPDGWKIVFEQCSPYP